jgi:RES domain-containing protein
MVYEPSLLDKLEEVGGASLDSIVWRHMFNGLDPARANTRGARWNPPGVAAIYTSLQRETALAEAEYAIASQPVRPSTGRQLYQVRVTVTKVIDLSDRDLLAEVNVGEEQLVAVSQDACRTVGGAVHWLGYDGLVVPLARTNLVLYADRLDVDAAFEVLAREDIGEGHG